MLAHALDDTSKPDRVVDYALVLGLSDKDYLDARPEDHEVVIRAVTNIVVCHGAPELPDGDNRYRIVRTISGVEANMNVGSMGGEIYVMAQLCPVTYRPATGTIVHNPAERQPITGVGVIFSDKGEVAPPGYVVVPGNINKGSFGRTIYLCVERDAHKLPLTEIMVADDFYGESIPAGFLHVNKNLNSGALGHALSICYKVASNRGLSDFTYPVSILSRFPQTDFDGSPLSEEGLPMLCFPSGLQLKTTMELPTYFSFVVTGGKGEEVYCAALRFYEPLSLSLLEKKARQEREHDKNEADSVPAPSSSPDSRSLSRSSSSSSSMGSLASAADDSSHYFSLVRSPSGANRILFCPKCICLMSHWPFYDAFALFLKELYQISLSPSPLPIERYIADFMSRLPFPPAGGPPTLYQVGHLAIRIVRPSSFFLPMKNFSFRPLFEALSLNNILDVFSHVLAERKVILYSNNYSILTPVAESLRTLMFPLQWQFAFVPVLPSKLAYVLRAPVPLLIGIHRTFLEQVAVTSDVVLVDLDRNSIRIPRDHSHHEAVMSAAHQSQMEHAAGITVPIPEGVRRSMITELRSCANVYRDHDTSAMEVGSIYVPRSARQLSASSEDYRAILDGVDLEDDDYDDEDEDDDDYDEDEDEDDSYSDEADDDRRRGARGERNSAKGRRHSNSNSSGSRHGRKARRGSRRGGAGGQGAATGSSNMDNRASHGHGHATQTHGGHHRVFDEREIQDIFLRFFVFILQDYRDYLAPVGSKQSSFGLPFNVNPFLKTFPSDMTDFMTQLTSNQAFASFAVDRSTPSQDLTRVMQLHFFDWCIAIEAAGELDPDYYVNLERKLAGHSGTPVIFPPLLERAPELQGRGEGGEPYDKLYRYETFPVLNSALFDCAESFFTKGVHRGNVTLPETAEDKEYADIVEHMCRMVADEIVDQRRRDSSAMSSILGGDHNSIVRPSRRASASASADAQSDSDGPDLFGSTTSLSSLTDTANVVVVNGLKWDVQQLMAVYEMWFTLFLGERAEMLPQDHPFRRDLLVVMVQLRRMVDMRIPITPAITHSMCMFCAKFGLIYEFQLLYRLQTTLFPGFHPDVEFFSQATDLALASQRRKACGGSDSKARKRFAQKRRALPERLEVTARCARCSYELVAESILSSLDEVRMNHLSTKKTKALQLVIAHLYNKTAPKPMAKPAPPPSPRAAAARAKTNEIMPFATKVMQHDEAIPVGASESSSSAAAAAAAAVGAAAKPPMKGGAPDDLTLVHCPRCQAVQVDPRLNISMSSSSSARAGDAEETSSSAGIEMDAQSDRGSTVAGDDPAGGKKQLRVLAATLLRDAFQSKRRIQLARSEREMKRREEELKKSKKSKTLKKATAEAAAASATSSMRVEPGGAVMVSLKDLDVLDWIVYDSALYWNLFFYFGSQGLPVSFLLDSATRKATVEQHLQQDIVPEPLSSEQPLIGTLVSLVAPRYCLESSDSVNWGVILDDDPHLEELSVVIMSSNKMPNESPVMSSLSGASPAGSPMAGRKGVGSAAHGAASSYLPMLVTLRSRLTNAKASFDVLVDSLESIGELLRQPYEMVDPQAGASGHTGGSNTGKRTTSDLSPRPPLNSSSPNAATLSRSSCPSPRTQRTSSFGLITPPQFAEASPRSGASPETSPSAKNREGRDGLDADADAAAVAVAAAVADTDADADADADADVGGRRDRHGDLDDEHQLMTDEVEAQGEALPAPTTNLDHLGSELGDSEGLRLLRAVYHVLNRCTPSCRSRRVEKRMASLRVIGSAIQLLCEISGMEPRSNLLRNLQENPRVLASLAMAAPLPPMSPCRTIRKQMQAAQRFPSPMSASPSPTGNQDTLSQASEVDAEAEVEMEEPREVLLLVQKVSEIIGSCLHSDLIVKGGLLVLCNHLLVVSAESLQHSRVERLVANNVMDIVAQAMRRFQGDEGVVDVCCYVLSIMSSALPPVISVIKARGLLPQVVRACTAHRSNLHVLEGGIRLLVNLCKSKVAGTNLRDVIELGTVKLLSDTLYNFVYAPHRARTQLHINIALECCHCLQLLAGSESNVALLTEEGIVKLMAAVIANPVYLADGEQKNATASALANPTLNPHHRTGSAEGHIQTPNERRMVTAARTSVTAPSAEAIRSNSVEQALIDTAVASVLAELLSFPTMKTSRRVCALVTSEEAISILAAHCTKLLQAGLCSESRSHGKGKAKRRGRRAHSNMSQHKRLADQHLFRAMVMFSLAYSTSLKPSMLELMTRAPIAVLMDVALLLLEILRKQSEQDKHPTWAFPIVPDVPDLVAETIFGLANCLAVLNFLHVRQASQSSTGAVAWGSEPGVPATDGSVPASGTVSTAAAPGSSSAGGVAGLAASGPVSSNKGTSHHAGQMEQSVNSESMSHHNLARMSSQHSHLSASRSSSKAQGLQTYNLNERRVDSGDEGDNYGEEDVAGDTDDRGSFTSSASEASSISSSSSVHSRNHSLSQSRSQSQSRSKSRRPSRSVHRRLESFSSIRSEAKLFISLLRERDTRTDVSGDKFETLRSAGLKFIRALDYFESRCSASISSVGDDGAIADLDDVVGAGAGGALVDTGIGFSASMASMASMASLSSAMTTTSSISDFGSGVGDPLEVAGVVRPRPALPGSSSLEEKFALKHSFSVSGAALHSDRSGTSAPETGSLGQSGGLLSMGGRSVSLVDLNATKNPSAGGAVVGGSQASSFSPWKRVDLSRVLALKSNHESPRKGMRRLFARTASKVFLHDELEEFDTTDQKQKRKKAVKSVQSDAASSSRFRHDSDTGSVEEEVFNAAASVENTVASKPSSSSAATPVGGMDFKQLRLNVDAAPARSATSSSSPASQSINSDSDADVSNRLQADTPVDESFALDARANLASPTEQYRKRLHHLRQKSNPVMLGAEEMLKLEADWVAALQIAEDRVRQSLPFAPSTTLLSVLKSMPEVVPLLCRGVPEALRYRLWSIFTGADRLRNKHPLNYYDELVTMYLRHGSECKEEIVQDLHRTLPHVEMFKTSDGKAALERVLGAYSLMDPDVVGYCQSMNMLCAALLTYLEEEETFWILSAMVLNHVGYYTKTMCALMVDQRVLADLFAFSQPYLKDVMLRNEVTVNMFTVSWFLCMFVDAPLPLASCHLFWDSFFFFGDEMLFRMALRVIRDKTEEISRCDNIGDMLDFCLHGGIRQNLDTRAMMAEIHEERAAERQAALSTSASLSSSSSSSSASTPWACEFWDRIVMLRKFHRHQVLMENRIVDHNLATQLIRRFGFTDEDEIQTLWAFFLSPNPWKILQEGSISSVLDFHQAFCTFVYNANHRAHWRDHGLFSGVVHRMFRVLDVHESGRVSLIDFLRGVSILCKRSVEDRFKLCFDYFDLDENGWVDREEVQDVFEMFHAMYKGEGSSTKSTESAALTNALFEQVACALEERLSFKCFRRAIAINPYVKVFFRLGTEEEIRGCLQNL